MKNIILFIALIVFNSVGFAQTQQFQTYTADLLVIATKGGENVQWQNKDILVLLNYETGDFKVTINNGDFYNKQTNIRVNESSMSDNSKFIFEGNLPIRKIINQKAINQGYDVELQLTNNDISFSEIVNFKMNVMRPNQTPKSYRVFTLSGVLYN
ncbi:MAG: hypothetical protein QM503_07750, partial [Bacteroidota bacterium]